MWLDEASEELGNTGRRRNDEEMSERFDLDTLPTTRAGHVMDREITKLITSCQAIGKFRWERPPRAQDDVLSRAPADLAFLEEINVGRLSVLKAGCNARDQGVTVDEAHPRAKRALDYRVRGVSPSRHVRHVEVWRDFPFAQRAHGVDINHLGKRRGPPPLGNVPYG